MVITMAKLRMAHASRLGQKNDFRVFLLFTASIRSQPPGPPLVFGVLLFWRNETFPSVLSPEPLVLQNRTKSTQNVLNHGRMSASGI